MTARTGNASLLANETMRHTGSGGPKSHTQAQHRQQLHKPPVMHTSHPLL